MIALAIKPNLTQIQRLAIDLGAKQVPFATSLALNELAKGVQLDEQKAVTATFDHPTPFTQRAFRIEVASKAKPIAVVAAKDIQANYLEPYVAGGDRYLGGKKGMIVPKAVGTNQYGNLTRGKLAALKAKPGIFIGRVTTKDGRPINGVWQRPTNAQRKASSAGSMKLLIRFEDTMPAPKHLPFVERASAYVRANAAGAFQRGLARAMQTARRR